MVAFVLTFSFVRCQMSPQIACSGGCKVTLAACNVFFVWSVSFSNVSLDRQHVRMQMHIGCICWAFHHSLFSNVSLNVWIESQIGCNGLIFLHCALSNVSSNRLHVRMKSHIGCNYLIFSTVRFHIYLQIADMRGCKATLVALIWFSSSVCLQATPQKACPGKCIVILVAFVRFFKWFFSSLAWKHA